MCVCVCVRACVHVHAWVRGWVRACACARSDFTYIVWADVNVAKPLWVAVFDAANVHLKHVFKSREEHIEN